MTDIELLKYAYENYAGSMLTVCLRYCHDRAIAEDMLHDGYIQAYKNFNKFTDRGKGSLKAWMERVMANTCLQYLRKKDLLRMTEDINDLKPADYDYPENDTSFNSFSKEYLSSDVPLEKSGNEEWLSDKIEDLTETTLLKIIGELPTGYRTVFNLYVFENYSHKEIGEMLGINERSSSSQYFRAKKLLAKRITEYIKNEGGKDNGER